MAKKPPRPRLPPKTDALDQAQQIMSEAFEASRPEIRVRLAKQALAISPDCADAYLLLSEHASSMQEALSLLEQGVAAGERALGKSALSENAGHFWGLLETRPYMRARAALIQCLWSFGRRDEAVENAWEMLRLNPNDNQGIRYTLAACLLQMNRNNDLRRLLSQYEGDSTAAWKFGRALLEFRQSGEGPAASRALEHACEANPHVSDYILGIKQLPAELPSYYTLGEATEAATYVVDNLAGWKGTPGALAWLRKELKAPLPEAPPRAAPSWPLLSRKLTQVPQLQDEMWQVDIHCVNNSPDGTSAKTAPWVVLITSPAEDSVLTVEFEPTRPDAKQVWEYLIAAMLHPKEGEPLRPAGVEVRLKSLWTAWRKKLAEVGIECSTREELEHVDQVLAETIAPLLQQTLDSEADSSEIPFDPTNLVQYEDRVWQADVRRLPVWVGDNGEPRRPWSAIVLDRDNDLVLAQNISTTAPTPVWLAETVLKALRQPAAGEPCRPGLVQVLLPEFAQALESHLAGADVQIEVQAKLVEIDNVFQELSGRMKGPDKVAPLLEVPGVGVSQVGEYFTAAAEFYAQSPWRSIPGDAVIKVECAKFQSGPWYAVVMGQSAMTYGLAIYEGLDALRATLHGDGTQPARDTSALSLTYGEEFEIPIHDLEAIETHGWPVAAPEAYPFLMRVNPGLVVRPPLSWELELVTACLRVVPQFVRGTDRSPRTLPAAVAGQSLQLCLSHVADLEAA